VSDDGEASAAATVTSSDATTGSRVCPEEDAADDGWLDELGRQARDWYRIGMTLQAEGRLPMAASLLIRASCLEPDSAELREVAARAQFRAGHYLGAHTTFSGMLALAPKDHFALYASAVSAACLGWLDHALDGLSDAVRRRPDVRRYARALDVVQRMLDELDGAEPVQLPSYCVPPIPIDPRLASLELGPRPGESEGT
jgi:tetratricopeptide (TPR) repeat protein